MQVRIIAAASVLSLMLCGAGYAADKTASPAPKAPAADKTPAAAKTPPRMPGAPGPETTKVARVLEEWKALLGDLGALKVQYRTADDKQRPEIEKKWKELMEKAEPKLDELLQTAQKAYLEAPNANKEVSDLLFTTLVDWCARNDYENALPLARVLVDNKYPDRRVVALAGIAALSVGELDSAETLLKEADKAGMLDELPGQEDKGGSLTAMARALLADPAAAKEAWAKEQKIRAAEAKADDLPRVLLKTSQGDIELELFENEAPNTVANFLTLVESKRYDGLTFHRVLPGFMAQGGDPKGDGSGGPGYSIACECYRPDHRLHYRGSLSMAHAGRDTGGQQFFLTFVPTSFLDPKHTVFGRVVKGMDVLGKLQRRNPEKPDMPPPDKIVEAKVLRKRPHPYTVKKVGD